ncbi:MAG: MerR family DNA-binding transcriptional regulator [Gammaproteobacteria bacterium]|nr:MerR family DNA-binding transcriptional regulator [Gammaproteobacteria bacterium]NNJ73356.1 MerR family DNA-binding transcriptional regulator [Enterobacterales bacterium]
MTDALITISDLSKSYDITARTLRHYEELGLLNPERNGTQRLYCKRDRTRLVLILRGKRIGFSLTEIKEILDMYDLPEGEQKQTSFLLNKIEQRRQALHEQQQDISSMLEALSNIEHKLQSKH